MRELIYIFEKELSKHCISILLLYLNSLKNGYIMFIAFYQLIL
ncbi:hypothetical protein SYNTR_1832 [Candidatus Syntrophocurvum alkaliphilum]|uniref:Uncharacterized protein n=1 Tax=Candidatus Syntrophocurvum alkaliphilum TaxID=2293317 RepID=A0A6I6DE98_9FIRM|nr:hypothetical protein SYNTR_1832 [Candidatus Syntrophocurvum alkaliphilum]